MLSTLTLEQQKLRTFEIVNRSDSAYVKRGTENSPNPVHLNSPRTLHLTMRSKRSLGERKGFVKTQYVIGAPTIFEDDVYKDADGEFHSMSEKPQSNWILIKGLKSLGYDLKEEYRKAVKQNICFEFGILSLDKYGDDPTLLEYINNHEANRDATHSKHLTNRFTMFDFRCVKNEEKASKKLDTIDVEAESSQYIASLRTTGVLGNTYNAKNANQIDAILTMFEVNLDVAPTDYNQKHLAIKNMANADPLLFMNGIKEFTEPVKLQIATGFTLGILDFTDSVVTMICGEKKDKKTNRKLLETIESNKEGMMDELTYYFLLKTKDAPTNYRDFVLLLEAHKSK